MYSGLIVLFILGTVNSQGCQEPAEDSGRVKSLIVELEKMKPLILNLIDVYNRLVDMNEALLRTPSTADLASTGVVDVGKKVELIKETLKARRVLIRKDRQTNSVSIGPGDITISDGTNG